MFEPKTAQLVLRPGPGWSGGLRRVATARLPETDLFPQALKGVLVGRGRYLPKAVIANIPHQPEDVPACAGRTKDVEVK